MSKTVRWGVIGCGGIAARRTIPEFQKLVTNAQLVSVMDIDAPRAQEVARQFQVPHACGSEAELLKQNLDAVYIASPPHLHCQQIIQTAQAGKHILCEKPLAINEAEMDQIEAACAKAGVQFMLGFCMRNNIYHVKARELVQAKKLGQMVMGRAQLTCWYPPIANAWRQNIALSHGGCLIDMGNHCLDILEWIMDTVVVEVTGFQNRMTHAYATDIEDASTIAVRFKNGAHGIVDNYFNLPDAAAQNALELHGTRGSLIAAGTIGQEPTGKMFSILQEQETGYDAGQTRTQPAQRQEYHLQGSGLYAQMITQFSDCIMKKTPSPVTLADGRHSVRLVEAIYRAVKEKKVITVP